MFSWVLGTLKLNHKTTLWIIWFEGCDWFQFFSSVQLISSDQNFRFNCLDYLKWYLLYKFFEIIDLIVLKFYFGSIKLNWIGSFEICIFFNYLKLKTD